MPCPMNTLEVEGEDYNHDHDDDDDDGDDSDDTDDGDDGEVPRGDDDLKARRKKERKDSL